jgi:photosynthetic reaction center H subunit
MPTGAITGYIDVAQLVLYAFWIFFAGLVYYLHRENKREGYPLVSDRSQRSDRVKVQGFPAVPEPKTYLLPHGQGAVSIPRQEKPETIKAVPAAPHLGAPLIPTGNPMLAAVGPGSYSARADRVDLTWDGDAKIVPLRVATDFSIESRDPDPRGMDVIAGDGQVAGRITDVWVDRSEVIIRYLEAEVGAPGGTRRVLIPRNMARVNPDGVSVKSIYAEHFADVPGTRHPDQVTLLEEDKICAYYAGGMLYADPKREEPWF